MSEAEIGGQRLNSWVWRAKISLRPYDCATRDVLSDARSVTKLSLPIISTFLPLP